MATIGVLVPASPGHLNPMRAAETLKLLRPSLAIPIHWGTFATPGARRRDPSFLTDPPHQFAQHAVRIAPDVTVLILQPGECASIAAYSVSS